MTKYVVAAALAASTLFFAADSEASVHQVCVRYQIQTADSALATDSPREDHFLNGDVGIIVPAYGAFINVYRNGSSVTGGNVATNAATGCHTFFSPLDGLFTIRVYARSEDSKDNGVRIHNASTGTFGNYPGSTYSLVSFFNAPVSGTHYVTVGSAAPRWTMMAAASFILRRMNDGNSDKFIHIAEDKANNCSNSSWWGASNDSLDDGRAYLRIKSGGACNSDSRTGKFLVGHEMGHALLRLRAKNKEGPWTATFPYGQLAGSVASCTNDSSYGLNSVEWASLAFKEGSADFISARAFNNRAGSGRYGMFGANLNLEVAAVHAPGGRLVNVCNVAQSNGWGLGIKGDWLRFWWDWYTDNTCSPTATKLKMMDVFSKTVNDHQDGSNVYLNNTAYSAVRDALDAKNYGNCLETRFDFYSCWNGIDRQAGAADNNCY